MAISKTRAESAITALLGSGAPEMFDKIRGNQHSMEKHFSKQTAYAAAQQTGYPQGYFKQVTNFVFKSSLDLTRSNLTEKTVQRALLAVNAKKRRDFGKMLGKKGEITIPQKSVAGKDSILDVIDGVIRSDTLQLRQNNDDPDTRFLAVSEMPPGFYGRSIDDEGDKAKDCDYAVVVVNATVTRNPQIVTVFPADFAYVNNRPLLQ
jgi:hypothetical protein